MNFPFPTDPNGLDNHGNHRKSPRIIAFNPEDLQPDVISEHLPAMRRQHYLSDGQRCEETLRKYQCAFCRGTNCRLESHISFCTVELCAFNGKTNRHTAHQNEGRTCNAHGAFESTLEHKGKAWCGSVGSQRRTQAAALVFRANHSLPLHTL